MDETKNGQQKRMRQLRRGCCKVYSKSSYYLLNNFTLDIMDAEIQKEFDEDRRARFDFVFKYLLIWQAATVVLRTIPFLWGENMLRDTTYGIALWATLIFWAVCRKFYPEKVVYTLFVLAGLRQCIDALGFWSLMPESIHHQDAYTVQDNIYINLAYFGVINNASWKVTALVSPLAVVVPYFF